MRWFRPHRDEIDAVLGNDLGDDDLADVAAIVHNLRAAYLADEPLTRRPVLTAFTGSPLDDKGNPLPSAERKADGPAAQVAGLPNRYESTRRKSKMLSTVGAFVATTAGKVVLGTAVAAASVGGLHATDVVDVPGLPDTSAEETVLAVEGDDEGSIDEIEPLDADTEAEGDAEAGDDDAESNETDDGASELAHAKQEQIAEFKTAQNDWKACSAGIKGEDDDATEDDGAVEDEPDADDVKGHERKAAIAEACGEKPHPRDFGVTDAPGQADKEHPNGKDTSAKGNGDKAKSDKVDKDKGKKADEVDEPDTEADEADVVDEVDDADGADETSDSDESNEADGGDPGNGKSATANDAPSNGKSGSAKGKNKD